MLRQAKNELAAQAQLGLGEVYFERSEWDKAIEEYLKVVILYGVEDYSAEAQYKVGQCYEQKKAAEAYQGVLEQYAKTKWAEQAKERLEWIKTNHP